MGLFGDNNTTQKTTTVPWGPAQKPLTSIMTQAAALNKRGVGFNAPKFPTYAPMSDQTQQALGGIWGAAQAPNPLAGQSQNAISGILNGTPGSNPAFEAMLNDQSQQTANDVQRQFSGLGRSGSGADVGVLTDRIAAGRNAAMAGQYNQDIAQRLQAVQEAPGAYQQQFQPYQMQAQVGSAYDDLLARQKQAQIDKFNTNQQAPWNRLNAQLGATTGASGGMSSQSSTVQAPHNPFGGALGGGILGGQAFGIPGAIGGGILGLLGGL